MVSETSLGQDPVYGIYISVKPDSGYSYGYYHQICLPVYSSGNRDLFTFDTPVVEWENVTRDQLGDYSCHEPEYGTGESFSYSRYFPAYEGIVNVRITRKGHNTADTMMIVFPIKILAFMTSIDLTEIEFREGMYDLTNAMDYKVDRYLIMKVKQDPVWEKVSESILWMEY